jgi:uncharacterized protein YjiS (DUF1127 family)
LILRLGVGDRRRLKKLKQSRRRGTSSGNIERLSRLGGQGCLLGGMSAMTAIDRHRRGPSARPPAPAAIACGGAAPLPLDAGRRRAGAWATVRRTVRRISEVLLRWHERRRQRGALLELNDHLLRDIGISRDAALGEATKPFWRD